jgi:magnesium transporter
MSEPDEDQNSAPAPAAAAAPPAAVLSPEPSVAEIRRTLREGRIAEVVTCFQGLAPRLRAELFLNLRVPDQTALLAVAPPELAASLLADSDSKSISGLLSRYDLPSLKPTLRLIHPEDLADILLHLPVDRRDEALSALDAETAAEVLGLMTFDPESAGGLMTPRYLSVPVVVSAGRALELLRTGKEAAAASYVYGVDAQGRLQGVVPLRTLLLANPRKEISSVMVPSAVRLKVSTPVQEIVEVFSRHHYVSLPVVDDRDRLVGIVTADDVMKEMRRLEDLVLQGVTGVDAARERLRETFAATRGRLPWITVTIAGGLGCAFIGKLFEQTLAESVMLGIFAPLVLALSESIAAQTASVVLSTLASGTLDASERRAFTLKEISVGLLVAVYAGVVVTGLSHFWHGNPRLGLLIGGSILVSMVWSAILAVSIPVLLHRFRVNPAIASGPLVLTIGDLSTLGVYFGAAAVFLPYIR